MSAADTPDRVRVHVSARDVTARAGALALVRRCGITLAPEPDGAADTVVVAAAQTVEAAIDDWIAGGAAARFSGGHRLLVMAETFSPSGVLHAVRAGAYTMLRSTHATPEQLAAAVAAAHRGGGLMPYEVLIRLLGGSAGAKPRPVAPAPPPSVLTARQLTVLALMADGHGNAAIARALSCSEHTVKNVIYDLTARLQVRNRAQAVACAVRRGLI
ncbi:MAG TPA: LuxR C-terminal-related transcriptional regulator [Actinocrinis sp.]|nr:LuxR C-terminal-related transcriptional regulator [Actinocrinis sp.]